MHFVVSHGHRDPDVDDNGPSAISTPLPRPRTCRGFISVFGSSVANGEGCTGNCSGVENNTHEGGCYQSRLRVYQGRERGRCVINNCVSGDSTRDGMERLGREVLGVGTPGGGGGGGPVEGGGPGGGPGLLPLLIPHPHPPVSFMLIGFSLLNEGLLERPPALVAEEFVQGIRSIIRQVMAAGVQPVLGLCYPCALYNDTHYPTLLDTNIIMQQLGVPTINFRGALDDNYGRWVPGHHIDEFHPNDQGSTELYYTIVPTLWDAMSAKKPYPVLKRPSLSELSRTTQEPGAVRPLPVPGGTKPAPGLADSLIHPEGDHPGLQDPKKEEVEKPASLPAPWTSSPRGPRLRVAIPRREEMHSFSTGFLFQIEQKRPQTKAPSTTPTQSPTVTSQATNSSTTHQPEVLTTPTEAPVAPEAYPVTLISIGARVPKYTADGGISLSKSRQGKLVNISLALYPISGTGSGLLLLSVMRYDPASNSSKKSFTTTFASEPIVGVVGSWHSAFLCHSYANQLTEVFLDGEKVIEVYGEQWVSTEFELGQKPYHGDEDTLNDGQPSEQLPPPPPPSALPLSAAARRLLANLETTVKARKPRIPFLVRYADWAVHRASLHAREVEFIHHSQEMLSGSLEVYTGPLSEEVPENTALSQTQITIIS